MSWASTPAWPTSGPKSLATSDRKTRTGRGVPSPLDRAEGHQRSRGPGEIASGSDSTPKPFGKASKTTRCAPKSLARNWARSRSASGECRRSSSPTGTCFRRAACRTADPTVSKVPRAANWRSSRRCDAVDALSATPALRDRYGIRRTGRSPSKALLGSDVRASAIVSPILSGRLIPTTVETIAGITHGKLEGARRERDTVSSADCCDYGGPLDDFGWMRLVRVPSVSPGPFGQDAAAIRSGLISATPEPPPPR